MASENKRQGENKCSAPFGGLRTPGICYSNVKFAT